MRYHLFIARSALALGLGRPIHHCQRMNLRRGPVTNQRHALGDFGYVQCWCDRGHGLKVGRLWEPEGGSSKVWSGNVGEKSLIVVKNEWLGQSGDLITHWWQLIIEGRREESGLNITTIS